MKNKKLFLVLLLQGFAVFCQAKFQPYSRHAVDQSVLTSFSMNGDYQQNFNATQEVLNSTYAEALAHYDRDYWHLGYEEYVYEYVPFFLSAEAKKNVNGIYAIPMDAHEVYNYWVSRGYIVKVAGLLPNGGYDWFTRDPYPNEEWICDVVDGVSYPIASTCCANGIMVVGNEQEHQPNITPEFKPTKTVMANGQPINIFVVSGNNNGNQNGNNNGRSTPGTTVVTSPKFEIPDGYVLVPRDQFRIPARDTVFMEKKSGKFFHTVAGRLVEVGIAALIGYGIYKVATANRGYGSPKYTPGHQAIDISTTGNGSSGSGGGGGGTGGGPIDIDPGGSLGSTWHVINGVPTRR